MSSWSEPNEDPEIDISFFSRWFYRYNLTDTEQWPHRSLAWASVVSLHPWIPYELDFIPFIYRSETTQPKVKRSVEFEPMENLDAWYIENQSIWLDVKIIVLTPLKQSFK